MRNPSKNTIKKLMRPANGHEPGWGQRGYSEITPYSQVTSKQYFLFNIIGASLYNMSKRKICNRKPKGFMKYLTKAQIKKLVS